MSEPTAHLGRIAILWRGDEAARRSATRETSRFKAVFAALADVGVMFSIPFSRTLVVYAQLRFTLILAKLCSGETLLTATAGAAKQASVGMLHDVRRLRLSELPAGTRSYTSRGGTNAPCMVLTFGSRCYAFRLRGSARLPREAAAQTSRPLPRSRGGRLCRRPPKLLFRNSPV